MLRADPISNIKQTAYTRQPIDHWLQPLILAADKQGIDLDALLVSAGQPTTPDSPAKVDWIRYGHLLRGRLGWHRYPDQPASMN